MSWSTTLSRLCLIPGCSFSKLNLCNKLVMIRNNSILASMSPKHILGPGIVLHRIFNSSLHLYYAPIRRKHIVTALSVWYLVRRITLKLLLAFKWIFIYRMRGSAEPKNHNSTLYIYWVNSPSPFFIIDACLGHILERTKAIEMKLGL